MLRESIDQGIINIQPQPVDDLPRLEGEERERRREITPQNEGRSIE